VPLSFNLLWSSSLVMSACRFYLGSLSLSQPRSKTRLVTQVSVDVSAGAPCLNASDIFLSSVLQSNHWTTAKSRFTVSFVVSFEEDSSLPYSSQRAFLKQLGKILTPAEVRGSYPVKLMLIRHSCGLSYGSEQMLIYHAMRRGWKARTSPR
jgi:hypothetical protein